MNYPTLHDLYLRELRGLVSAGKQMLRALPKISRHVTAPTLRRLLEGYLGETRIRAGQLEDLLERHQHTTRCAPCRAMEGTMEAMDEWLDEETTAEVMDMGIIGLLQRAAHHEIVGYGCARAYAALLGYQSDEYLLADLLEIARQTDSALTGEARQINAAAYLPVE